MAEEWREIAGTDYSVSDQGRIASRKKGVWRVLRPRVNRGGYLQVTMCNGVGQKAYKVHTLVANAFIGQKPTPKHGINHRNGVKTDNRPANLEWVTPSANQRHRFDVLGQQAARGEAHGQAKLTETMVRAIRSGPMAHGAQTRLAKELGVSPSTIGAIARKSSWAWLDAEVAA